MLTNPVLETREKCEKEKEIRKINIWKAKVNKKFP